MLSQIRAQIASGKTISRLSLPKAWLLKCFWKTKYATPVISRLAGTIATHGSSFWMSDTKAYALFGSMAALHASRSRSSMMPKVLMCSISSAMTASGGT